MNKAVYCQYCCWYHVCMVYISVAAEKGKEGDTSNWVPGRPTRRLYDRKDVLRRVDLFWVFVSQNRPLQRRLSAMEGDNDRPVVPFLASLVSCLGRNQSHTTKKPSRRRSSSSDHNDIVQCEVHCEHSSCIPYMNAYYGQLGKKITQKLL